MARRVLLREWSFRKEVRGRTTPEYGQKEQPFDFYSKMQPGSDRKAA